jgi:predicted MFS family arabinose efflux permease
MRKKLWCREFVAIIFSNLFLTSAFYALLPTLPIYLTESLHFSQGLTGTIAATISISIVVARPFTGYVMDNFHRFAVLVISLFALTVIGGVYLLATTAASLFVLRLAHGAVFGTATSSIATIAADIIPPERRGEGIGILGLTSPLGMAVGPLIGLRVLESHGARLTFVAVAVISLLALLSAASARIRYKKPERKPFSLNGLIHTRALPVSLAMFFVMAVYGSVLVFVGIYALQRGFSNVTIFFLCFSLSIVLSRLLLGRLFDKGYIVFLVAVGLALVTVGMIWLGLARGEAEFVVAGMFAGFGFGTLMPTGQAKVNDLVEPGERGAANSTYFFSYDVGIGTGAFLVGILADKMRIADLYLYSSLSVIIGAGIFFLVAIPHYKLHRMQSG